MRRYKLPVNHLSLLLLLLVGVTVFLLQMQNTQIVVTHALTNCTVDAGLIGFDPEEAKFLTLINNYRQQNGAGALIPSLNLTRASAWLTHDMSVNSYLDHTDKSGRAFDVRITDCGYSASGNVGENILYAGGGSATTTGTADKAFAQWKSSPGHDQNMKDPSYRSIGIAREWNGSRMTWTTDFGGSDDGTSSQIPTSAPTTGGPTPMPTIPPSGSPTKPIPTSNPGAGGSVTFAINLCPHALGDCGDNVTSPQKGNYAPKHPTRNVVLVLIDSNNQQVGSQQGSVTYDPQQKIFTGAITMGNIIDGNYLLKVKTDGYLMAQAPGILALQGGRNKGIALVNLITGDVNNDNRLDILDYNALAGCFGAKQQSATCTEPVRSDLDDDGKVDGIDYNIFIREISTQRSA